MADESIVESIERADVALSVEAGQARDHPATKVGGFISEIADQPPAFTLSVAAMAAGVVLDRRDVAEAGARCFIGLTLVTIAKSLIKASVTRTRPFMIFDHGEYRSHSGGPNDGPWNSFPSGHTGNAVVTAAALRRIYPKATIPLAAGAAAIGAIQVPRASHHALDVVAGAALGLAVDAAVTAVWPVGRDGDDRKDLDHHRD